MRSVETQLRQQPTAGTRNRKRLRPNETAEWELRIGQLRVFYNADEQKLIVTIKAIGLKVGNLLFIRGEKRGL